MNLFLLAKMSNTQRGSGLLILKSSSSKLRPWLLKFKDKRKGKKALSRSKSGSLAISYLLSRVLHLALLFLEFSSLEIGRIGFLREIKAGFRSIRRVIASCTLLPLARCGIQRAIFYSIPMRCEFFCLYQTYSSHSLPPVLRAQLYLNGCRTSNMMVPYLLALSQEADRTPTFYLILLLP